MFNINKLFDSGCRLERWDETKYQELIDKNNLIKSKLGRFCASIDDDSFAALYDEVDITFMGQSRVGVDT